MRQKGQHARRRTTHGSVAGGSLAGHPQGRWGRGRGSSPTSVKLRSSIRFSPSRSYSLRILCTSAFFTSNPNALMATCAVQGNTGDAVLGGGAA